MYQRNNHNQNPRDNYNDDNYDSSESDSDSDAEMEENNEQAEGENAMEEDNNLLLADNDNDNANNIPNNDLEDEARQHNGILERIDYLDRRNDSLLRQQRGIVVGEVGGDADDQNLPDGSRPAVNFDENSRGNFELPLLGEGSGCNLNLDIPPPVNDESSRESMDIDYENDNEDVVELGHINVSAGNANKDLMIKNRDLDEDVAVDGECMNDYFSSNVGYDDYVRMKPSQSDNGGKNNSKSSSDDDICDVSNNCKCSKCALLMEEQKDSDRAPEMCNNCNSICCDKVNLFCAAERDILHGNDNSGTSSSNISANVNSNKNCSSSSSSSVSSNKNSAGSSKDTEYSCQKTNCSANVESDVVHHPKSHMENCDNNNLSKLPTDKNTLTSASDDSSITKQTSENCKCDVDDNEQDDIDRSTINTSRSSTDRTNSLTTSNDPNDGTPNSIGNPPKECDCYETKLDHVNGHSSKMCLNIPKTPCDKCVLKQQQEKVQVKDAENKSTEDAKSKLPNVANVDNAPAEVSPMNRNNIRPRDNNNDVDNVRPIKKVKLNNGSAANRNKAPRTIFHKALDAVNMSWDNVHLKNILASNIYSSSNGVGINAMPSTSKGSITATNFLTTLSSITSTTKSAFNLLGQPLWHEPLAMCAARVDSLRSHGHNEAALRLSVSVVRTMKQVQKDAQSLWHRYQAILAAQSSAQAEEAAKQHHHCCCDCRKDKLHLNNMSGHNNANHHPSSSTSMNSSKESSYKMYRYDYGNNSRYSNMGHEGCKRCIETRDRVGYHHFQNNYNRFNVSSNSSHGGHHPSTYFRNNFGPMHDQRFSNSSSNNFNSGYSRYNGGNSGYPPNIHNSMCHADNCNIVHRTSNSSANNSNMMGDLYSYFGPRTHCNKTAHSHENFAPPHRCYDSHEFKNRNIDGPAPSSSAHHRAISDAGDHQNCACRKGNTEEPSNAHKDAVPAETPAGPSSSNINGMKPCSQHTKNQCCIKNYCCKIVPNEKPKCCSIQPPSSVPTNNCDCIINKSICSSRSTLSSNIYFGKSNAYTSMYDTGYCHQKLGGRGEQCPCLFNNGPNSNYKTMHGNYQSQSKVNKVNLTNIVNYGASTSKAALSSSSSINVGASTSGASTSTSGSNNNNSVSNITSVNNLLNEFIRNKKQGCVSNCLDCAVGCEVEFPLDAVACIFDCLTEACIIPDAINGPDMGRLSFDSVSGAAEDGSLIPPRYQHVPVPLSNDRNETYLTLSFEAATLALGKQRIMPQGLYSQHVICKQQDQLIARLRHVDLDRLLVEVLKQLTTQMLDGGPSSGLGNTRCML